MVSIDMPAGPSEVLVIADARANPVHVAADLLSQAEHGPDSQVVLVIVGESVDLSAIEKEISKQCQSLPRGEYASKALAHSFTVIAHDVVEAISFSNIYAPEHLILNVEDAEKWESLIENAVKAEIYCDCEAGKAQLQVRQFRGSGQLIFPGGRRCI